MKLTRFYSALLLLAVVPFLYGCLDNEEPYDPFAQLEADVNAIDAYLANNAIAAVEDIRGVRMVITKLGKGLPALETNKVKVAYSGRVLGNTTAFETGVATGAALGNYILGWRIALTTLPLGSKATIYVPSPLAYGNSPQGSIPANSILVFDLDYQDVEETETERQKLKADTVAIDSYLTSKEILDVESDTTGIRYKILAEGTGNKPSWYTPVNFKVDYRLLSDDTNVVLSQTLAPSDTYSSRVIDQMNALKFALQQLGEGGKATLYVPSGVAFGTQSVMKSDNSSVAIPANSILIVDVELIDIP
jgi:FKBP-type peptidyl-prolyl cis-trans isomerase